MSNYFPKTMKKWRFQKLNHSDDINQHSIQLRNQEILKSSSCIHSINKLVKSTTKEILSKDKVSPQIYSPSERANKSNNLKKITKYLSPQRETEEILTNQIIPDYVKQGEAFIPRNSSKVTMIKKNFIKNYKSQKHWIKSNRENTIKTKEAGLKPELEANELCKYLTITAPAIYNEPKQGKKDDKKMNNICPEGTNSKMNKRTKRSISLIFMNHIEDEAKEESERIYNLIKINVIDLKEMIVRQTKTQNQRNREVKRYDMKLKNKQKKRVSRGISAHLSNRQHHIIHPEPWQIQQF